ncbi:hypothetical protein IKS86_08045 [bacterium]|nr:hypothetical protein [bacterium]
MKKILVVFAILCAFFAVSCGSGSKNEDTVDTGDNDPTDDADSQSEPSDDDADSEPTDDADSQPDDDPEEPSYGGRGCNARTSYGSTSVTRDESSVFDSCATGAKYSDSSCIYPDPAELFLKLQKTTIVFKKECKQNDAPIPCPDFIPESITLSQLTGCNIYRNESTPNDAQPCLSECPEFYFSTDNETFKTVEFRHDYDYDSNYPFHNAFFESSNSERTIFLIVDTGQNTALFKSSDSSITLSFEILVAE